MSASRPTRAVSLWVVAAIPSSVLGELGDRGVGKRGQLLLLGDPREHSGVEPDACRRARDQVVEVGEDLEQVGEVVVELIEGVIQLRVAEQHDLDVDGDRLGLERGHGDQDRELGQDQLDQAAAQGPNQGLPGTRLGQDLGRLEHEHAAVGPDQRAGPDRHVVGSGAAVGVGRGVDGPEQRAHGRDGLDDDRRALVEPVAGQRVGLVEPGLVLDVLEVGQPAMHEIVDQRVEPGPDLGGGEQLAQLPRRGPEQGLGLGLEQLADEVAESSLVLADLAKHPIDPLADLIAALFELPERLGGQLTRLDHRREALGRDRLAVDRGEDHRMGDAAGLLDDEGEPGLGQLGLERLGQSLDLGEGLLLELLATTAAHVAVERRAQVVDDEPTQLAELLAKQLAAPALDGEQLGSVGVVPVADVEVIGSGRRARAESPRAACGPWSGDRCL